MTIYKTFRNTVTAARLLINGEVGPVNGGLEFAIFKF